MIHYSASTAVNLALSLLILFSLVTWALIFAKGWLQWRIRQENAGFAKRFWQAADLAGAEKIAGEAPGALARLAKRGFETLKQMGEKKTLADAGDRQAVMERSLSQQVRQEQHKLESGLMLLASIGSTAPFVGLFGTVWGIMNAMEGIARSGASGLEVVAGPVGEALLSTAIGIAAAIPAVLAYNYGVRVTRLAVAEMERFAHDFMNLACCAEDKKV
ncbi:MAG TPA: MotA/TolQ/ExbB proton channel family protein [Thiobacillaceae bacterium]|nr:MotA/TolQ/ExbB proton channel family protein [Thiobacillaceae bacterium]HNF88488.1 MotA/TolQ/ExbB proton channel family protein [Thiobacillaceae bacterium]HNH88983.1 MotA/TolQ/ExbB proton channel family protein [Thiobacillaceae bacterium]HNI06653.1 MotA/TolQ/ExbB proton channel family protein [Thiobacillaceae bacterium]